MISTINLYNQDTGRFTHAGTSYVVKMLEKNPLPTEQEKKEMMQRLGCNYTVLTVSYKSEKTYQFYFFILGKTEQKSHNFEEVHNHQDTTTTITTTRSCYYSASNKLSFFKQIISK
jgi:hypothetical protein